MWGRKNEVVGSQGKVWKSPEITVNLYRQKVEKTKSLFKSKLSIEEV